MSQLKEINNKTKEQTELCGFKASFTVLHEIDLLSESLVSILFKNT
ncbi:hypothetical protein WAX46_10350 [Bacillus sp. FJAT-53060]